MKRWLPVAALLLVIGAGLYFLFRPPPKSAAPSTEHSQQIARAQKSNAAGTTLTASRTAASPSIPPAHSNLWDAVAPGVPAATPTKPTAPAPSASTAPDYSGPPPATVLENLRNTFHQYAAMFGGNPVGTNPEITRALNGGNAKQVQFVRPEDGLRINEQGEMVDPWGTPFFFHQLSGKVMEIHSAGPDRKMWTADDLVIQ